jgi:hypothetical protein
LKILSPRYSTFVFGALTSGQAAMSPLLAKPRKGTAMSSFTPDWRDSMRNTICTLAIIAGVVAGSSSLAFAQDPVSAAIGTAGAIAGAAIGTAGAITGDAVGTTAAVVGAYPYGYDGRPCPRGYRFYSGACYLR